MKKTWIAAAAAALLAAAVLTGCGKDKAPSAETQGKTVNIAYVVNYPPYDYQGENKEPAGMEPAVMAEVAKREGWNAKFIPTSSEDLLIGLEAGKYDVGIKGVWKTAEREKKFIFPKHYMAASVIGITFRAEDKDKIHSLEDFARVSGKLVPISPLSAQYTVITEFNKAHPDTPIQLVPAETFDSNDVYTWVMEGRYDAYFDLEVLYNENVKKESGSYHQFADRLAYVRYKAIPTYPLFNKKKQDLADGYDNAITAMKDDGTFVKLENQYFGEDIAQLVK